MNKKQIIKAHMSAIGKKGGKKRAMTTTKEQRAEWGRNGGLKKKANALKTNKV